MAPRRRAVLRALTTTAALALLLSSLRVSDASTPTPSAAPAPAPRPNATSSTSPVANPPPPRAKGHHKGGGAHGPPRAAPPPETTTERPLSRSWWDGLNLGQKVGLVFVAVAIAMQVAFLAFLAARARKLSRADRAWERRQLSPPRVSISGF